MKYDFTDAHLDSIIITTFADIHGVGRNKLYNFVREKGIMDYG